MKHHQMAHEWAHQNKPFRDLGNMSHRNKVIFSFSTAIAEIVQDKEGNEWYLYNSAKYSPTTSKHQHFVRMAIPSNYVVDMWWLGPVRNLGNLSDQISKFDINGVTSTLLQDMQNLRKLRSPARIIDAFTAIREKTESIEQYVNLMDLPSVDLSSIKAILDGEHPSVEDLESSLAEFQAKAAEAVQKREATALSRWKAGEHVRNSFKTMALRIRGEYIETTHNAAIPLSDAVGFWPTLKSWIKRNHKFQLDDRNEGDQLKLGQYVVRAFDGMTLTVGCHRIPVAELMAMAKELKLA